MVRLSILTLLWLSTLAASSTLSADSIEVINNDIPGAFILECEGRDHLEPVIRAVQERGGVVRQKFDYDIFTGISVEMGDVENPKHKRAGMEEIVGIKRTWPVQGMQMAGVEAGKPPEEQKRKQTHRRAEDKDSESRWSHLVTQIDKLHHEGFLGGGIKIAVVDSGVNYTNPVFGGCFGKGCRVAMGDNLVGEGNKGDPMDCEGHGTMVAGVLAGYDRKQGFVGVAPNATIHAYRVGTCDGKSEEDQMIKGWLKAYKDGAQIIVSSCSKPRQNWVQSPLATIVSRIVAQGIPCIAAVGNDGYKGFFQADSPSVGRGVMSVGGSTRDLGLYDDTSLGPTWDLDIKPNVVAPAVAIQVPKIGGDYGTEKGTSLASPLIGGVYALIAEARNTFDPAVINSLLMATARPLVSGRDFYTVARQGSGLIQAWDAAHAVTLVEPSGLLFNDTDHRAPSIALRIKNTGKSELTYQFSNIAATTMYPFDFNADPSNGSPQGADIGFDQDSITLGPGQSGTIAVSASDPHGFVPKDLPLWSGWVAVNGSDGTSLTVPYLGISGSLRGVSVTSDEIERIGRQDKIFPDPPSGSGQQPGHINNFTMPADSVRGSQTYRFSITRGSPQVRVDAVPLDICSPDGVTRGAEEAAAPDLNMACVPEANIVKFGNFSSIGQITDPKQHFDTDVHLDWNGSLTSGQYVPPGRYKLVAHVLSILGDAHEQSDYHVIESSDFMVAYEGNLVPKTGTEPTSVSETGPESTSRPISPDGPTPNPADDGPAPNPKWDGPRPNPADDGPAPNPKWDGPRPNPADDGPAPNPKWDGPRPNPADDGPRPKQ